MCGKIHTRHFPKLMLLRDDALAIKEGKRKLFEFQPRTDATKKLTTSTNDTFRKLEEKWGDAYLPNEA
jgi:hypothetical protein